MSTFKYYFVLSFSFCFCSCNYVLPDTSGISGQLTANLTVDQFFSLWIVFNNEEVQVSDKPFTILVPKNNQEVPRDVTQPDIIKRLMLDHVVIGQKLRLDDISGVFNFKTEGGKTVSVQEVNGTLFANNVEILQPRVDVPGGVLVLLKDYVFPPEQNVEKTKEDQTVAAAAAATVIVTSHSSEPQHVSNSTFFQNLVDLLSFFKNGVRVFQHFLSRSNVSRLLKDDEEYTVLIPTDHAFQRWHPIDWGFYPFSVPEFTETVIVNHFIPGNLRQENIKDGLIVNTLGDRQITFTRNLFFLSANGAPIVRGDTPIHNGNLMFVSEVLFVNEAEVQKLHQKNKDKETPPLLAFPWFGAQFLSHAFLALERQRKFTQITRFLNLADLAPYVSGKGYTFFVPNDDAFEKLGLDKVPDNYLSSGEGFIILLNHFVRGRLYDRDLQDGTELTTLGNKTIIVSRTADNIQVNKVRIVESEVFVYNLGTMFYIDTLLFTTPENLPPVIPTTTEEIPTIPPLVFSVKPDVEKIPDELTEEVGTLPDLLFEEDNGTTMFENTSEIDTTMAAPVDLTTIPTSTVTQN